MHLAHNRSLEREIIYTALNTLGHLSGSLVEFTFKIHLEPWLVWLSGLSVGCKPKGRQFDSQSGHILGCGPGPQ